MRTTFSIDDDVLVAARQLASLRGITVGSVISELLRASLSATSDRPSTRSGVTLLPMRADAKGATLEEVNGLRDEVV